VTKSKRSDLPTIAFVHGVMSAAPGVLMVINGDGVIEWISDASTYLIGSPPAELIGRNIFDYVLAEDVDLVVESLAHAAAQTDQISGQFGEMEFRYRRPNGSVGVLGASTVNRVDESDVGGIVVQVQDVTERRLADDVLRSIVADVDITETMQLVAKLVEEQLGQSHVVVGVGPVDGSFRLAASSASVDRQLGDSEPQDAPLVNPIMIDAPWVRAMHSNAIVIDANIETLPSWLRTEARSQGFKSCWSFPISQNATSEPEACIMVWRDSAGAPSPGARMAVERAGRLIALALERRRTHSELVHAARHDPLTGLPNRAQFFRRLARELRRDQELVAVLYLDLDGFKPINDRFGHRAGDQVLMAVSRRIEEVLRPHDMTGRLGGDEFGVICPLVHDPNEAIAIAERIMESVAKPIQLHAEMIRTSEMALLAGSPVLDLRDSDGIVEVTVSTSIGIVFSSEVEADHERLVELADAAMYKAKRAGRGTWYRSTGNPESAII